MNKSFHDHDVASFVLGGSTAVAKYAPLKRDFTKANTVVPAGNGDAIIGLANDSYEVGEAVGVWMKKFYLGKCGATIVAGAQLEAKSDGTFITKNTGTAVAVAHEGGSAGDFIEIELL